MMPDSSLKPTVLGNLAILRRGRRTVIFDPVTTAWARCDPDSCQLCYGRNIGQTMRKAPDWPDSFVNHICAVLRVTRKCNLDCIYCYAEAQRFGPDMDLAVARKIVDRLLQLPTNHITIRWSGGEPLMAFDIIREATNYARERAKKKKKKISFFIQTNATLLTESRIDEIMRLNIGLAVSIDGPPHITNKTRPYADGTGSYDSIARAIEILRQKHYPINCLVTVTNFNADKIEEVVKHLDSLGLKKIQINPCRFLGKARYHIKESLVDPQKYYDAKVRAITKFGSLNPGFLTSNAAKIVRNFTQPTKSMLCYSSPNCGAGLRILGFDYNGDVYPCDEFVGTTPEMKCGNVFESSLTSMFRQSEVWKKLRKRTVHAIEKCSLCIWRHVCGGGCVAAAYNRYGTILREDPYCEYRQRIFQYLLWKIVEEPTLINAARRSWDKRKIPSLFNSFRRIWNPLASVGNSFSARARKE